MSTAEMSDEDKRRMRDHARIATLAMLGVLVAVVALAGAAANKDAGFVAIAIAIAIATVGFLIGIIFGVRRGGDNHDETMLEVLGDWMSKILVGLTLTNLVAIPSEIRRLASYFSHESSPPVGSEAMVASIVVGAFVSGLLFGYLTMRFYLAHAFAGADQEADQHKAAGLLPPMQAEMVTKSPQALAAANDLANIDTKNLNDPQKLANVARAKFTLDQTGPALDLANRAVELAPNDDEIRLDRGVILAKTKEHEGAIKDLSRAMRSEKPDIVQRAGETLMFNYLYMEPPHGFEEAIRVADEARQKAVPKSAAFFIYLGAAYGQKYKYEKQKGAPEKDLLATRQQAFEAIRAGLSLDKSWKGLVTDMLAEGGDDDLSSFKDDKDFQTLVA